jgi:lysophospholipase L1-like esterase
MSRRVISRYAALGDSFTAGVEEDSWADELAAALRARNPRLEYRNLAVPGATSAEVARQVEPALAFGPQLVTLVCGANDILLSVRPDIAACAATLEAMLDRLCGELPNAAVVVASYPDFARFIDLGPRSRRRVARGIVALNTAIRSVARRQDVLCLELAEHPLAGERENFAGDGYHPSRQGTRRATAGFVRALAHHFGIDAATPALEEAL